VLSQYIYKDAFTNLVEHFTLDLQAYTTLE